MFSSVHRTSFIFSVFTESCSAANECQILDDVSWSPLWQPDVRNDIKVTKQPDSEINALR